MACSNTRRQLVLAFAASLAACKERPAELRPATPGPAAGPGGGRATAGAGPALAPDAGELAPWLVHADGVGELRLGGPPGPGDAGPFTALRQELRPLRGQVEELRLLRGPVEELRLRVVAGRVARIEVLAGAYATARGARLGMSAAAVEALHGAPLRLLGGEGETCAVFADLPAVEFCFDVAAVGASWRAVVSAGRPLASMQLPARD
jgi:hypothetical protein